MNTSSSRVEVRWNVRDTSALSEEDRARAMKRLGARVDGRGIVRVVSSQSRSQRVNREKAELRLADLVRSALAVQRKRKATAPSKASIERRLREKKLRSFRKRDRGLHSDD